MKKYKQRKQTKKLKVLYVKVKEKLQNALIFILEDKDVLKRECMSLTGLMLLGSEFVIGPEYRVGLRVLGPRLVISLLYYMLCIMSFPEL